MSALFKNPLTRAERMEHFLEAIGHLHDRRTIAEGFAQVLAEDDDLGRDAECLTRMEDLMMEEVDATTQVAALAMTMMADGMLDDCIEFLKVETAGCP